MRGRMRCGRRQRPSRRRACAGPLLVARRAVILADSRANPQAAARQLLMARITRNYSDCEIPVAGSCVGTTTASGLLLPSACVRFLEASARRGRRSPAGAHAVAVGAQRRLHCVPLRLQAQGRSPGTEQSAGTVLCPGSLHRPGVASQNSLRSLRSLRSDSCDESVYEACFARRPQAWPCRPRRAGRPGRSQGTSGPLDRLCPGSPSRRHRNRPRRAPPAARQRLWFLSRTAPASQQRRVRAGRASPLGRREAQGSWPRAKRESSTDSSRMSERSERSERSEFCDGATRPSIAGKSERSEDRPSEAKRPARTCLCRARTCPQSGRSRSAMGREKTLVRLRWCPTNIAARNKRVPAQNVRRRSIEAM